MADGNGFLPENYQRLTDIGACHPNLRQLYAVWQKIRGDRAMPARSDFDPAMVPKLLPTIFLVDVMPQNPREQRYRVRLMGTAQASYLGSDWTGRYLHERLDAASAERFCDVGDAITFSGEPWMSGGQIYWLPDKSFHRFETILLPLSEDGQTVNMILGLTVVVKPGTAEG